MSERTQKPKKKREKAPEDVVLVYGRDEAQDGYRVLRRRSDRVEVGVVSPLQHGKPITGDVVRLSPREGQPLLYDVETQYEAPAGGTDDIATTAGPAQVATEAYRDGWERLWGGRKKPQELLN